MVVASGEDGEVVGGVDAGGPERSSVPDSSSVVGDGCLLDIVGSLETDEKTVLASDEIDLCGWAFKEIEEGASVDVGLFEVKVDLGALGLAGWEERAEELGLETLCDVLVQLDLGVKSVDVVPVPN